MCSSDLFLVVPPTTDRSGWDRDVSLEYQRRFTNGSQLLLGVAYDLKSANLKSEGYSAIQVYGAYQTMLSHGGTYALLSGTYRNLNYRRSSDVDDRSYVRGALGVPLSRKGPDLEAGASYTVRNTNRPFVANYRSIGGDLRLIWRFGKNRGGDA